MKVVNNTDQELEILVELPRFILWFMLGPIAGFGGLFTLALLLGGEILNAFVTGAIIATIFFAGRYFLTQRTQLLMSTADNKVRILKTTLIDAKKYEFSLENLDGAEVTLNRTHRGHGGNGGTSRATSSLQLVFSNTRPATRVPVAGWSISGGGAGMLADTINDWLRNVRARNAMG